MGGKTHIIAGAALAAALAPHFSVPMAPAVLLGGGLGGLGPDVDHPKALISTRTPVLPGVLGLFGLKHRGFTHSLAALALAFLLFPYLHGVAHVGWVALLGLVGRITHLDALGLAAMAGAGWRFGFTAGWASHILADMLNPGTLQLFWPSERMVNFPLGPLAIPVGSFAETAFRWALLAAVAWFISPLMALEVGLAAFAVFRMMEEAPHL